MTRSITLVLIAVLAHLSSNAQPVNINHSGSDPAFRFEKKRIKVKLTILSDRFQLKRLNFAGSSQLKIYCNDQLIYEGRYQYHPRSGRQPGEAHFDDFVVLPLVEGKNSVVLIRTDPPDDLGISGQLDNLKGIALH